nr:unnamed protein product [Callosobruchus chinensis]
MGPRHIPPEHLRLFFVACFPNRLISRFGDVLWPPRSPDLSICDFFLWRWLKSLVFEVKPRTPDALMVTIRHEVSLINRDMLEGVEGNFCELLQQFMKTDIICQMFFCT